MAQSESRRATTDNDKPLRDGASPVRETLRDRPRPAVV